MGTSKKRGTFEFTIVLEGVYENIEEFKYRLVAASCGDAVIRTHPKKIGYVFNGKYEDLIPVEVHLVFNRRAKSLTDAIISVIKAIEGRTVNEKVSRIIIGRRD